MRKSGNRAGKTGGYARLKCYLVLFVMISIFACAWLSLTGCNSGSGSNSEENTSILYTGEKKHSIIGELLKETAKHASVISASEFAIGWVTTKLGLESEEDEQFDEIMEGLDDISGQIGTLQDQVTLLADNIAQIDVDTLMTSINGNKADIKTSIDDYQNLIGLFSDGKEYTKDEIQNVVNVFIGGIKGRDLSSDMTAIDLSVDPELAATPLMDSYNNTLIQEASNGSNAVIAGVSALESLTEMYAYLSTYQVMAYMMLSEYYHYEYPDSYQALIDTLEATLDGYLKNLNNSYLDNAEKIICLFMQGDLTRSLYEHNSLYYGGVVKNIGYVTASRSAFVRIVWTRNAEVDPDSRYETFISENPFADEYKDLWDWLKTAPLEDLPELSFNDDNTGDTYVLNGPSRNVFTIPYDKGINLGQFGILRYEIPYTSMGLNIVKSSEDPDAPIVYEKNTVSASLDYDLKEAPMYKGQFSSNANTNLLTPFFHTLEMNSSDVAQEDGEEISSLTLVAYMPLNHYSDNIPDDENIVSIDHDGNGKTFEIYKTSRIYYKRYSRVTDIEIEFGGGSYKQLFYMEGDNGSALMDGSDTRFYSYGYWKMAAFGDFYYTLSNKKYYINKDSTSRHSEASDNHSRGFNFEKKYF
ncbi:MAG: hypothetical protein QM498_07565, partial [Desulfobacterium sp.]